MRYSILSLVIVSVLLMSAPFPSAFAEEASETTAKKLVWKSADTGSKNEADDEIVPDDESSEELDERIDTEQEKKPVLAQRPREMKSEERSANDPLTGLPSNKPSRTLQFGKPAVAKPSTPELATEAPKVSSNAALPVAKKLSGQAAAEKSQDVDDHTGESYLFQSSRKAGSADLVETLLEVTGTVKQLDIEQKEIDDKLEVVAGFRYEERLDNASKSGAMRSLRKYSLAKAKMKIADSLKVPELDADQRLIVCSFDKNRATLFSPAGPLKGEQMLLIEDLPGNTLILDRLLPKQEVKIGDSWKIDNDVLQAFLSVDAVTQSNIEAVLTAVADNMAMVEIVGDVEGIYLGAHTVINVRAKYQFDLAARRINWLGMMIEENRSIGHVGPGLDLVARLQVKISPLAEPDALTDDAIEHVNRTPTEETIQLRYADGKGPWRFAHDRSWYVSQDEEGTTILRKLHRGELVAQCNIADMGQVDLKSMTSLATFKRDLVDGLGENFGEVIDSQEDTNEAGYKEYRITIEGSVEDLPLRWVYYLLTDKNGKQAVIVFVIGLEQLDVFGQIDRDFVTSFKMGK